MFDEVHCEADLPPGHPETNRDFQTKSLASCLDRFTITKEGRLIFHAVRYEASDEPGLKFPMKAVQLGDVDTEFHGDILLVGRKVEESLVEYVARFTHGTLEWIRPLSELSQFHKMRLM